jgi:uncharacterized membrane protein
MSKALGIDANLNNVVSCLGMLYTLTGLGKVITKCSEDYNLLNGLS